MKIEQHKQFSNAREVVINDKPLYNIFNNRATDAEFEKFLKLVEAAPKLLEALNTMKFLCECDIADHKTGLCHTDKYAAVRLRDVILPAINAATETESTMHPIFEQALKPSGIK